MTITYTYCKHCAVAIRQRNDVWVHESPFFTVARPCGTPEPYFDDSSKLTNFLGEPSK